MRFWLRDLAGWLFSRRSLSGGKKKWHCEVQDERSFKKE
jgi:hypothetical protein